MKAAVSLLALMGMACATPALAAGFDCTKAASFSEKTICADPRLSEMDDALGVLYKRTLATSADPAQTKAAQKSWLAERDRCADAACIARAYLARYQTLSTTPSPAATTLSGTYKGRNGQVVIRDSGAGRLAFELSVVVGMNTGDVSGEALVSGKTARYADAASDCDLTFSFADGAVAVKQAGSCDMGMNVSASGTYKAVRK